MDRCSSEFPRIVPQRRQISGRNVRVVNRVEQAPQNMTLERERFGRTILRLARDTVRNDILQAELRVARRLYEASTKIFEATAVEPRIELLQHCDPIRHERRREQFR